MLPDEVAAGVDPGEPGLDGNPVGHLQVSVAGEQVAAVRGLVHRVGDGTDVGAGLTEAVEEAVHAPAVRVLPLEAPRGVELEQQGAGRTLARERAVGPV